MAESNMGAVFSTTIARKMNLDTANDEPLSPDVVMLLRDAAARGAFRFPVGGDCMQPVLNDGDMLDIRARRFYLPGDIVVFRGWDGRLLAHRLLGFYRRDGVWKMLARADDTAAIDAAVPVRDLVGAVHACNDRPLPRPAWRLRLHRVAAFVRIAVAQVFAGRVRPFRTGIQ